MKATYLKQAMQLKTQEIPKPKLEEDKLLIKIKSVGTCGSDIHYYKHGKINKFVVEEPLILGHGALGVVHKAWNNISKFSIGDADFIDIGIDILNTVQLTAKNMEPEKLKSKYGSNIAFWGAIDGQELLPRKSPEEVRDAVRNIIKTLSKNGGYLLASCHNIQNDVSAENIVALFDEANKFET